MILINPSATDPWLAGWLYAWLRIERARRDDASWNARLRRLANPDPLPGETP